MVYQKQYRRRPKPRYQRRGAKRGKVYGAAAGQLYKDVMTLKNAINVEFKSYDIEVTSTSITPTAARYCLNAPAVGDDYDSRDGRQVRFKSIQLTGFIGWQSAAATAQQFRYILMIDKQPNDSLPAFTEAFTSENTYSLKNLDNKKRFAILKDKRITLSDQYPVHNIKFYKKLDMITMYDSTAAGIASVNTNSLLLFIISNAGANSPQITWQSRVRYIDN